MHYTVLAAAEIGLREIVVVQDSAQLKSQIAVTTKDAEASKTNVVKVMGGAQVLSSAFSLSSLAPEGVVPI